MTEQVQNEEAVATAPVEEQKQEAEADQAGAIKLITEKLESSFDEQTFRLYLHFHAISRILFHFSIMNHDALSIDSNSSTNI